MAKEIAPGVTLKSFNKEYVQSVSEEQFIKDHEAHDGLNEEQLKEVYAHFNPAPEAVSELTAEVEPVKAKKAK